MESLLLKLTSSLFLLIGLSFAGEISLEAPCSTQVFSKTFDVLELTTVQSATQKFLNEINIPHNLTSNSLVSAMGTPTDLESYEVVSDREMYVYGWCYEVNGVIPEQLINQLEIGANDKLHWFYGFAHYDSGEWISYCTPAKTRNWEGICPKD